MADNESSWSPDSEAALKTLIRETVKSAGVMTPDALPHQLIDAIKRHASGDVDIDAYIKKVLKEAQS